MAVRRASEFRNMGLSDLREELQSQKETLYQLRYRLATHQLSDVTEIRKVRKEIARICTLITEKQREAETSRATSAAPSGSANA